MASKKLIDPQPIIKRLADRCLAAKGLECSILGQVIDMLKAAPAAEAKPQAEDKPRKMLCILWNPGHHSGRQRCERNGEYYLCTCNGDTDKCDYVQKGRAENGN